MATKRVCDICGGFCQPSKLIDDIWHYYTVDNMCGIFSGRRKLDVCVNCMETFFEWRKQNEPSNP